MDKKVGNILKYSISIILAVILLWFCFRKVDWSDFMMALRSCRWEFVILSMLSGLLSFLLRGIRWRELLLPIDPSTSTLTCFNAVNISYAINLVLPRVGEVARCGFITARSAREGESGEGKRLASFDKVVGTAALERSADLVFSGLLIAVFLFFTWDRFGAFFSEKVFGAAGGGISTGKILLAAGVLAFAAALVWVSIRYSGSSGFLGKAGDFCKGIFRGFLSCLKMKRAWLFFALTVGIWACYWLEAWLILIAVQGISPAGTSPEMAAGIANLSGLGIVDALFIMLVGNIASLVPVPGGFGAYHFMVSSAMSFVYGIPAGFGMIFATLSHEAQTLTQIVSGGLSYISETVRK